uniref:Carbohydrate sulfotransferase n=1 Tax=Paramormyrops kingsleyae TaxID=1676925 RepID=A0A3B3RMQ7_9TELE
MPWVECKTADPRCGRRRLRTLAMKLPCFFWFLLLFGAGGLVLFTHLQDLSETFQQQAPGQCFCRAPASDARPPDSWRKGRLRASVEPVTGCLDSTDGLPSSPVPPMDPGRTTKRRRKLLLKSTVAMQPRNLSSSLGGPPDSWRRLAHVQEARKRLTKEVCAKYMSTSRKVTPQHVSRIFVEDRHKLLYCEVPKVGCSNWKRVLMVLAGLASSTRDIQHDAVHYGNHLRRLDSFDHQGIAHRLRTYTKVLFVREPFERLVSAFRDKFENPNTYYHPVFGKPIISRYRANASQAALRTGAGVTFKEFMQYLLDVHRPVGMDIHWEHVGQLCSPCLLDYDFIGKFETIEEDANFLLRRTGAAHNLTFPSFKDRNPHAERTSARITHHYFAQLDASERQRAYDFYYMDYLMFNYSKPFKDLY